MSKEVLIRDLQQKSSDRIKEMWREAEKNVKDLREEQNNSFTLFKSEEEKQLQELERSVAAPIVFKAEKEALLIVDEAMRKLSERLYAIALRMLPQLRKEEYPEIFASLVEELPPFKWEAITVNELDVELAKSFFPSVEIRTDPALSGGFTTSGDNGNYRVINTLERRLEKAWPFVLPALLREITGERDVAPAV